MQDNSKAMHANSDSAVTDLPDRTAYSTHDVIRDIWTSLKLPPDALKSLDIPGSEGPAFPSSFKIGTLAQSSIALSALSAALFAAHRDSLELPRVRVPLDNVVVEFKSEQYHSLEKPGPQRAGLSIGGLHKTKDGHVRVHDLFPNHVRWTLELLGLPADATRKDVAAKMLQWRSVDLETAATDQGSAAIYALRSYHEWDALPQAKAISNSPILLQHLSLPYPASSSSHSSSVPRSLGDKHCLRGIRVVELSRVIAAPVAGKTLAAHGADVIWVTSPNLPDAPTLDREFSRGKRSVQLDLRIPADKQKLLQLLRTCDVFLQGYRPGSLAASHGLSPEALAQINPGMVYASLSAFGPSGPWAGRRGFDSLVQTCSGMNASEAERAGQGEVARPMPCQALDHAAGYLLATGIMAALYRRAVDGGGGRYKVDVSLAGTMKYLRSLGQYPGASGFECGGDLYERPEDVPERFMEEWDTIAWGKMKAVRHSAEVEGRPVGWERGPSVLGSDEPEWLIR